MRLVRFAEWDSGSEKSSPHSLLGGKNLGGNLGYGEPFHHVFLAEEIRVLIERYVSKLNEVGYFLSGRKKFV